MTRTVPRPLLLLVALLVAGLSLTGCASDADTGGAKGFVTRDGQLTTFAVGERERVATVEGKDLEGAPVSLQDLRGSVVVVNVWGSWCTPCRAEAADLVTAYEDLEAGAEGSDVAFLGINTRDPSPEAAQSFQRTFEVPYPSLFDQGGTSLLAFGRPLVIPSTVVVDAQGRIAAAVLGELPSPQTLVDLVDDVRAGA